MVSIYALIIHDCADKSNTMRDCFCKFSLNSDSIGDNFINGQILLWLGNAVILSVAFPKIHEQTERHQPEFILLKMHLADAVIEKPGK